MSKISQIKCDAPKCGTLKQATNHWWIIREMGTEHYFSCQPMHNAEEEDGDQHFCSTPCMHAMLEQWMQSHMEKPTKAPGPRCTCKDTYEVGSGNRCPVHEIDSVGMKLRKEINDRERTRIAEQVENNRREDERINRPA